MNKRDFPIVTVTPKEEASLRKGHPWVYGEEIISSFGEIKNGGL